MPIPLTPNTYRLTDHHQSGLRRSTPEAALPHRLRPRTKRVPCSTVCWIRLPDPGQLPAGVIAAVSAVMTTLLLPCILLVTGVKPAHAQAMTLADPTRPFLAPQALPIPSRPAAAEAQRPVAPTSLQAIYLPHNDAPGMRDASALINGRVWRVGDKLTHAGQTSTLSAIDPRGVTLQSTTGRPVRLWLYPGTDTPVGKDPS